MCTAYLTWCRRLIAYITALGEDVLLPVPYHVSCDFLL